MTRNKLLAEQENSFEIMQHFEKQNKIKREKIDIKLNSINQFIFAPVNLLRECTKIHTHTHHADRH